MTTWLETFRDAKRDGDYAMLPVLIAVLPIYAIGWIIAKITDLEGI